MEVGVEVGVEKCSGEGHIERLWDTLLKGPSLLRTPNAAEKCGYTLTDYEVLSILADAFIK